MLDFSSNVLRHSSKYCIILSYCTLCVHCAHSIQSAEVRYTVLSVGWFCNGQLIETLQVQYYLPFMAWDFLLILDTFCGNEICIKNLEYKSMYIKFHTNNSKRKCTTAVYTMLLHFHTTNFHCGIRSCSPIQNDDSLPCFLYWSFFYGYYPTEHFNYCTVH